MKNLNYFIDILEKDYSNFTATEHKNLFTPHGYITVPYTQDDLGHLDVDELEILKKALKDGYYYTSGTVSLNKRYDAREEKTIYDEIDFPELEFQFKKIN